MVGVTNPTNTARNLRESMPQVTAFIDELREAFGTEEINAQIKLGMQGAQTFHAVENGIEVGTRFTEPVKYITADQMVIRENSGSAERRPGAAVSRETSVSGSPLKNRTPRKA